jgi:hypothetical protein
MTLTRSGRSVNRPAKYVNAATVLEPTQPSPLKRPREEAILKPAFDAPKTDRVVGLRFCGEKEPAFVGSRLETEADSNRDLSERLRPSAECSTGESDNASKDIERTVVVLAENVVEETDANASRPHQFFFFASENTARWGTIYSGQFRGQKSIGPLEISLEIAHYVVCPHKNNIPHFQNQRCINS